MKHFLYYLSILLIFISCSTSTKKVIEEKNVIHLKEAIANPVKMNLSEIMDSVAFIPISSKENFIRDPQLIFYSKPYLMVFPGCIYNMNGEFIGNIGAVGQGPGEECGNWLYTVYYDESKELFYTKGDKIIQFDKNRKFTGKEIRIAYRNKVGDPLPQGLNSPYHILRSGKYNVLINYPDSAYWMDENLQIVKRQRLIPENLFLNSHGGGFIVEYNYFTNNDTTFLFNCFTDELCSVTENGFIRKWRLDLGEDKADSRCFLNNLQKLYWDEQYKILRTAEGNVQTMKIMADNSKLAELIDGKKWIGKVWETDRYVMLTWTELMAFQGWRSGRNMTHWAFHDKKTGETKSIKYLVNDIDGFADFSNFEDIIGINDGVLMKAVWPYQVYSYIQRKKEKGEPVDPRLEELLVDYDEEDNPILFLYYLKK
jgi:hypothetical protein